MKNNFYKINFRENVVLENKFPGKCDFEQT